MGCALKLQEIYIRNKLFQFSTERIPAGTCCRAEREQVLNSSKNTPKSTKKNRQIQQLGYQQYLVIRNRIFDVLTSKLKLKLFYNSCFHNSFQKMWVFFKNGNEVIIQNT